MELIEIGKRSMFGGMEEIFYADTLGTFETDGHHLALMGILGRRPGLERLMIQIHKGEPFLFSVDGASHILLRTFAKGYRVFRQAVGRGMLRLYVVPNGTVLVDGDTAPAEPLTPFGGAPTEKDVDPGVNLDAGTPGKTATPPGTNGKKSILDAAFQIRTTAVWRGENKTTLWQRIVRQSPIPLLPEWEAPILDLLMQPDHLDALRIQEDYPARNMTRLIPLTMIQSVDALWGGAMIDLDLRDLAIAATHCLKQRKIAFT